MGTVVPLSGVVAFCLCTQKVSSPDTRSWWTKVWFVPTVRADDPSQSSPTPNTQELLRVVTRLAVGAPVPALPVPVAPTAPEPFVPVVSTPLKVTTVIEA